MVDQEVHPEDGADDEQIWANLQAADDAIAAGEEPPEPFVPEQTAAEDVPDHTPATQHDIWASAPDELRAAYQATREQAERESQNHRRVSGTVSALQRQINELKARPASVAQTAAVENVLDSPALKQAREEYPEVVGPLMDTLTAMHAQNADLAKQVTERFTSADQQAEANYYAAQENALSERHADWRQQTATPAFAKWLHEQPQYVRDGIERNGQRIVDANEAADIIGRFKGSIGAQQTPVNPQASKRQHQLVAASAPKGRSPARVLNGAPDPDTDPQGYWKYLDEQEQRRGRQR